MSGAMTSIKMDDVLSSIRRLVSEVDGKTPEPVIAQSDRFVLTPALRVRDESADFSETTQADELAGVLSAAASAASPGAPKDETPQEAPPKEQVSPEFEAMELAWEAELARVAAARNEIEELGEAADYASDSDPRSLELQIAELEEAVSQSQEEWEPDGSEPEAGQLPKRHIFEVVDNTKAVKPVENPETSPEELPVFSHTAPRPKPYLLSEGMAPTPESTPEPVHANETTAPTEVTPAPAVSDTSGVVDGDDVFLDVEALRKMITEVLREELRGKLGESITRNVRRMMQQEIATAIGDNLDDDELD